MSKSSEGGWRTIRGNHVFISPSGTITKGPKALIGLSEKGASAKLSSDSSSKSASSSKSKSSPTKKSSSVSGKSSKSASSTSKKSSVASSSKSSTGTKKSTSDSAKIKSAKASVGSGAFPTDIQADSREEVMKLFNEANASSDDLGYKITKKGAHYEIAPTFRGKVVPKSAGRRTEVLISKKKNGNWHFIYA